MIKNIHFQFDNTKLFLIAQKKYYTDYESDSIFFSQSGVLSNKSREIHIHYTMKCVTLYYVYARK